jgi:uncharacterized damage-inducible protein DinB
MSALNQQIHKILKFKLWMNELTFSVLAELPETELLQERKGTFKSLIHTQNHIYVVDHIFKSHLTSVNHPYVKRYTDKTPPLNELREMQLDIDKWFIEYTNSLSEKELLNEISFNYVVSGEKDSMSRSDIVHHLVTHNSYHNGHLRDMMYHLSCVTGPLTTDYSVFLKKYKN